MPEEHIASHRHYIVYSILLICVVIVTTALVWSYSRPPANFMAGTVIHIEKNSGLSAIDAELSDQHIIRSPLLFRIVVTILGVIDGKKSVGSGDYLFKTSENIWQIAYRLVHNEQDLMSVRVTFPEGITVRNMAGILATVIDTSSTSINPVFIFDIKGFLALASTSEGYLFPDTYLFLPNETSADIITTMKNNFNEKIATLSPSIVAFQTFIQTSTVAQSYPRTLANIVTMASILEREATSTADRRIIAGILWKRLDAGQPLQVDAPFFYILGTTSVALTATDLATTSPYNTYNHTGLTPTPIGNPGFDALTDAIMPTSTKYWYYVSDKMGAIHYAVTYAEQEVNTRKYVE